MMKVGPLKRLRDLAQSEAMCLAVCCVASGSAFAAATSPGTGPLPSLFSTVAVGCSLIALTLMASRPRMRTAVEAGAPTTERVSEDYSRDDLTGCLTRRRFLEVLNGRLAEIRRRQINGLPYDDFTLMLLDVDHFKLLNDGFGHHAGDAVLETLGRRAQQEADWVVGRLGGDEFAVIVPGNDHRAIAHDARRFLERLGEELHANSETRAFHGISIGVASAPADADQGSDLLKKADMALYVGKRSGRGQVTFYHGDMQRKQAADRQNSRDLHAAIILNRLDLHYQPIVDVDRRGVAVEALLRWTDQTGRSIPPDTFIQVAERSELIDRLGEWVFRKACEDLALLDVDLISVNISGAQLRHDGLLPMLVRVLRETNRSASSFILELTETVLINADQKVFRLLGDLRALGFRIALDDFGTGNSSFTLLRDLPIDIVKIDKSFIQRLENDRIAQVFVSAVGEIAKSLDIVMVAEGVETQTQQECARIAGAQRFQGWLHGKAAPLKSGRLPERSLRSR